MTDDDDLLAAEFALGLLDPAEAEAAQARARTDAALSLRIAWWRDQLAPLVREVEAAPPDRLWRAIETQLPGNDNAGPADRWRSAALGAMAVAAALLVFIGLRPPAPAPLPVAASAPMIATLSGDTGALVTVAYDKVSGRMTVMPAALDAGRGDAELWMIPEGGKPHSMGVIPAKARAAMPLPADARALMRDGVTFAVSLEPKGGSPSGAPTGPVVASGKIFTA